MHRLALPGSQKWLVLAIAVAISGCAAGTTGSPSASDAVAASASASNTESAWTLLVFGDSWPFGAHCDGCRPWPTLYAEGLRTATGQTIDFKNRATNGGTAQELAATIKSSPSVRADIETADIVAISIGANDLEPAFDAWSAGTCGGADKLDCFRDITETLRTTFEGMLTEIDGLRAGKPTAVKVIANSNEFLFDVGLMAAFGSDFGKTGGVTITTMMRDMYCGVAAAHNAACIDLGLALNGPDLLTPADINSQATMQKVADLLVESGVDELQ